jgi:hypothetical protein
VFSLTLCSVSVLFFYIYDNSLAIQGTPLGGMPGTIAVMFMKASMDVREEIYILLTVGSLLILPQILSYLISGMFGCGSPPSTVSRIVTWSLIKFFCVLSGILAAQSIFAFYGKPYLLPKDSPAKLVEALLMICLSVVLHHGDLLLQGGRPICLDCSASTPQMARFSSLVYDAKPEEHVRAIVTREIAQTDAHFAQHQDARSRSRRGAACQLAARTQWRFFPLRPGVLAGCCYY